MVPVRIFLNRRSFSCAVLLASSIDIMLNWSTGITRLTNGLLIMILWGTFTFIGTSSAIMGQPDLTPTEDGSPGIFRHSQ